MKQLLHTLNTGKLELIETPIPGVKAGHLLIQSYASIISKGTEESLLAFGRASLLKKAQLQPDKVAEVLAKFKTEGVASTFFAIRNKLQKPSSLGYAQSGVILKVGADVFGFSVGDRVISNGPHSEIVSVPANLCVKIDPTNPISFEEAAFTPIAAIALQSIRLLNPTLGETIAVQGLGLIGLITVQLLRAQGCRVIGIDYEGEKLKLAKSFGAEVHSLSENPNPIDHALAFSKGQGVDGVIIAASTPSSDPIHYAAQMSRKRGRIILVGATGTQLRRTDFYEKELSFQVSCSYGPGRYETNYEQKGLDYPIGFVRWTEKRNMEAILLLLQEKKISFKPLISHRFPFTESLQAYDLFNRKIFSTGIILSYPVACHNILSSSNPHRLYSVNQKPVLNGLGVIGAGDHTTKIILPLLKKMGVVIDSISSQNGLSAAVAAKRYHIAQTLSDADSIITDPKINTLIIATRHDSHAALVIKGITHHKHIFIEKPLAITLDELKQIEEALIDSLFSKVLWVGFNRRYSVLSQKLKSLFFDTKDPKQMVYTVNALSLPKSHWVHDSAQGGGRLVGELCHFIDLLRYFAGCAITNFTVSRVASELIDQTNSVTVTLSFEDGSLGTLIYTTLGNRIFPKERIEVFAGNKVAVIDNFRSLKGYGFTNFKKKTLWVQDKGHKECLAQFLKATSISQPSPESWKEILEVSKIAVEIQGTETQKNIRTPQVA